MRIKFTVGVLLLVLCFAVQPVMAEEKTVPEPTISTDNEMKPSFDCRDASTKIEKMICAGKGLIELDQRLTANYYAVLRVVPDKKRVKNEQLKWLKKRDKCANQKCLAEVYRERIEELEVQEQKGIKAIEEADAKSGKCWKRLPPLEKSLMSPEYNTVCKAFEEVLNTTCEPPEKLRCNWTLPAGEKRFKKLVWQPLDPKEYWELIGDIAISGWGSKHRAGKWEKLEPEYKKYLESGRIRLSITTVDIDQDSRMEQVVRYGLLSECAAQNSFGVMIPETKRIDWRYEWTVGHINGTHGAEIMLYNDKAYMFGMDTYAVPGIVMVYKGFAARGGTDIGSRDICRFNYLKEGK